MMNSKNENRLEHNCRKKVIYGEKNVPKPTPTKLVWVINMEGSAFMPTTTFQDYEGDAEVKDIMLHKTLPEINKNIGKIWVREQQNTLKSQIFPTVHILIKILLFFLCVSLIVILLFSEFHTATNSSILIFYLYCVLICCIVIMAYTFSKEYKKEEYDAKIIRQIQEILYECNNLYLKSKGYVAKCDEWGIWISVSLINKNKESSHSFSNDSS